MKRRHFTAAVGAALAMPRIARAQAASTLRFVPQGDLAVLDPVANTAVVTRNHAFLVYDTLFGVNEHYEAEPQMLESFASEGDGKVWTLQLREGLRFHNGDPVLARDVVASIRRWAQRDNFGSALMAATEELSAVSDRVLRFRLRTPFPLLPQALGKATSNMPCIMPEYLARTDASIPVKEVVGSGPFRYLPADSVPGARVSYSRFAEYIPRPGGKPGISSGPKIAHIDRVEWQIMPDPATALSALRSGEIDWWERPLPDLLAVIARDRQLVTENINPGGALPFLRFNWLYPPFDKVAIRRLVLSAVNQADFMTAIGGSDTSLWRDGVGAFMPDGPMATDAGMTAYAKRTDFDALRRELVAAGYHNEPVVMLVGTDNPIVNAASEVGADLLKRMGFVVDYQALDWGTVVQRRTSTAPPDRGGWNCFFVTADGDNSLDPAVSMMVRGSGRKAWFGWPVSADLEQLHDEWFAAGDDAARRAIAARIQLQVWQDVPFIPLGQLFLPTAYRRTISGILPGFPKFYNLRKQA